MKAVTQIAERLNASALGGHLDYLTTYYAVAELLPSSVQTPKT